MIKEDFYLSLLPGDVLLTFNKQNILSKLIWKFTKRENSPEISHSILYLGNEEIIESTIFTGVMIKNVKSINLKKYDIYIRRPIGEFNVDILIESIRKNAGIKHYAIKQIFSIFFRRIFNIPKQEDVDMGGVTCSELIAEEFRKIGIDLVPGIISADINPLDLYYSEKLIDIEL